MDWPLDLGLTWEDTADPTGVFRPGATTPLVPGGESREVTGEDVDEYLRALVAHRVIGSVRDQTAAFAAGFGAVVPPQLRSRMKGILDGEDLSVLIAGAAEIELDDWRKHAAYAEARAPSVRPTCLFTITCIDPPQNTFVFVVSSVAFITGEERKKEKKSHIF